MAKKTVLFLVCVLLFSFVLAACAGSMHVDVLFIVDGEEYGSMEFTGTEAKGYKGRGYEKKKNNGKG